MAKYTNLYMYLNTDDKKKQEKEYSLRIIGLISNEEVAKVLKNDEIVKQIITSPTVSLQEISYNDDVTGLRIVGVIQSTDDQPTLDKKKLFISEELELISGVFELDKDKDLYQISITGKKGTYMVFTDKDDKDEETYDNEKK